MRFLNYPHLVETVARFAHAINEEYPQSLDDLAPAYRRAITPLRPVPPPAAGITITYEDGVWARHCREQDIFAHILKGATPTDGPQREQWDAEIDSALEHIRIMNPDLSSMVNLLVTNIAVFNSGLDGGGSANTLPGLVLISPGDGWAAPDYAQCLVHEALHTALFIADVTYGVFKLPSQEMEADEYRALSAVKIGQMRPLDKALHAAMVAVPLMYMQHQRGVTTLVDLYTGSLRQACESLGKQRQHLTEYGRMLLDEMTVWAGTDPLDFSMVADSISSPRYAGYRPALAA